MPPVLLAVAVHLFLVAVALGGPAFNASQQRVLGHDASASHPHAATSTTCNASLVTDYSAGTAILPHPPGVNATGCCDACLAHTDCVVYVTDGAACFFKADALGGHAKAGNTAGFVRVTPPPPPPPPPVPGAPYFELVSLTAAAVVNQTQGMAVGIGHGFEGGTWWQRSASDGGGYEGVWSEAINDLPVGHPRWDLHMRVARWLSEDGVTWARANGAALLNSSSDCTGQDPCGAIFSPFAVFDDDADRWVLFYTCYTTKGCAQSNGQQMRRVSSAKGRATGLMGPFVNRTAVLNIAGGAGGTPDSFEGNLNCAMQPPGAARLACAGHGLWGLTPFKRQSDGTWLAIYGSAWKLGLAQTTGTSLMSSEWQRLSEHNPFSWTIDGPWPPGNESKAGPWQGPSIENPILTHVNSTHESNGYWVMVWDAMTRYWPGRLNHVGFSYSRDGLPPWSAAQYVDVQPASGPQPCGATRTPYGLVPAPEEGHGAYALLFTGDTKGYEPVCRAVVRNVGEVSP